MHQSRTLVVLLVALVLLIALVLLVTLILVLVVALVLVLRITVHGDSPSFIVGYVFYYLHEKESYTKIF